MVLHNPNNWHWVNKDVSPSAKAWLEKNIVGLTASDNGITAKIDSVTSMDGDCDVSQRKGKVITLFDLKVKFEFSGQISDDSNASGSITIPEVAHDTDEDEYVFEVELFSEVPKDAPIKSLVRSKIVPQMREKLPGLAKALIDEHGKDIQHAPGSNPSSGFSTPKYLSSSHINKGSSSSAPASSASAPGKVNTTSLTDSSEYRTTAQELYTTFTDPSRLAAFTRAAPTVFEGARPGGKFALFGGNVSGEYVELAEPTMITQKWRLAQWPEGHYSTLKIRFEQNDVDHVTVMRVEWAGVPVGQEEVTKRKWGEYDVRSIKTTFGFGTVL